MIVLRQHEIEAIRKMFNEVLKQRLYNFQTPQTLMIERSFDTPNQDSVGYYYRVDIETLLREIESGS